VISVEPNRTDRWVRQAAAVTGSAAVSFWTLSLADRWLGGGAAVTGPWQALTDVATGLLAAALIPVAIHVLAHPRATPLPPRAAASAVSGLVTAVYCLVTGLTVTTMGLLVNGREITGSESFGGPFPAQLLILTLTLLAAIATAVAMRQLFAVHTAARAGHRSTHLTRPDLADDLALLSARFLPGSPLAQGLAWANRGLDRWSWSPRRHLGIAARFGGRPGRVQPQPD
jgi:hypothetical protein